MSKNIFALDKDIGARSISDKSAYIGKGNTLELDETKQLYWKPIADVCYSIKKKIDPSMGALEYETSDTAWCYYEETSSVSFNVGDILYFESNEWTGTVEVIYAVTGDPGRAEFKIISGPDFQEPLGFYVTTYSVTEYYGFENLAFSYDSTGTQLTNLYWYMDKWGNKCYSVYANSECWPNWNQDTSEGAFGQLFDNAGNISEDKDIKHLYRALRIEAEQHLPVAQDGMRKSYTEGTYSFNSGEGNIAFGNNVSTLGRFNIGIRNNSFAAGARNFIRGIDAVAIGLNNTVTGQCAIGFGEGGQAIGYGSLTIGDHNTATDFYSVAGGYQCKSYGYASFTFGFFNTIKGEKSAAFGANNEVLGNNSFVAGAGNKSNRSFTIIAGQQNTVESDQGGAFGYLNTVIGNRSFAFGKSNIINNRDSIVLGFSNQADYAANFIIGHRCKTSHDYQIVLGRGNLPNTKGILVVGAGGYIDSETAKDKNAIVVKNNGRVECPQGLTLYAPADANGNQKKFMLKVDNNGNLSTEQVWDS